MKIVASLFIVIVLLGAGILIGNKVLTPDYEPPEGYALLSQAKIDSLNSLEPEVVVKDSFIYDTATVYKNRPIPEPDPTPDPEINAYNDSIINDSTYLIIHDKIQGTLIARDIQLRRAIKYTEVRVPYPKIIEVPKYIETPPSSSLYVEGEVMGNATTLIPGVEVGTITKSNWKFGASLHTDFKEKYFGVTVGYVFNLR